MDKLILHDGTQYTVTSISDTDGLTVSILSEGTLQETYSKFTDSTATDQMELQTEGGTTIKMYNGYTHMLSLSLIADFPLTEDEIADIVQVRFEQPDRLQEQITELQAAVIELAELVGGEN